jgi:cyclase
LGDNVTVKPGLVLFAVLISGICVTVPIARAQGTEGLDVIQVRPNFYMIAGAGGNIGVQIGPDGVVLVDAGAKGTSAQVLAEIRKLTDRPIRYIINTSADPDHAGGNAELSKAGQTIFPLGGSARSDFIKAMTGAAASILAEENVLKRMSGRAAEFSSDAWPTETYYQKRKYIYFNHEGIEILHQPAAHTDGDSVVFFRISDVVVAGDVLDTTRFPVIDLQKGGGIQGEIDALNQLIELAIPPGPFIFSEGGTYIIPGHGRLYDQADVVEYRDMIVIIRDVIKDMMQRGMTLEQIQAASPTKPYERQYGSESGPWTTHAFVEAVYKSLAGNIK